MTMVQMKPPPIKSKEAALVQITADQILKDAQIHRPQALRPPVQRIMDQKQLHVYKQQKRREFEDKLRRQRYNLSIWVRYGQWQQNLKQFARARSVFERALEIDYTNKSLWLKYAEMEMKNKFINHARNVWERAVYYLPRQDQFWFKYAYMEEFIGEYQKARDIFSRWMQYCPGEKAWMAFIKFQERMGQSQLAKQVLYKYLQAYPSIDTYLKVAKFESRNKDRQAARAMFQRTITELGVDALKQKYFIEFCKFQIRLKQYERARQIFQFGLRHVPKDEAKTLYQLYLNFQKEHGSKEDIDEVVLGQRRSLYKQQIAKNSSNYDAWINLINLQEAAGKIQQVRQVYEAAVKEKPPAQQKKYWRRYMYIWFNYAVFQQQKAGDLVKAQQVYERAVKLVPHKKFTFGKLWIFYAHFFLRCNQLQKARKVFGRAIGLFPKQKVFRAYIELQERLCQLDRVRAIYQKYCQKFSHLPGPWVSYAHFQLALEQTERCRQILGIAQQIGVDGLPDADDLIAQQAQQLQEQQIQE